MNTLLQKAFDKVDQLPKKEKEAFASFILEEIEKENRWDELLNNSKKQLSTLAKEALNEYKSGKTDRLNPEDL